MQLFTTITTLLATAMLAQAAPSSPNGTFFPTTCDIYACGWCHWYYDKDVLWTREQKWQTPDGVQAEGCLDSVTQRWIEPCSYCKKQPYCQGDCIPA